MKFKLFSVTLILLFFFDVASAQQAVQKKQYIFFLTDSGKRVATRDSADYMRLITEPDKGGKLYDINEYYKNGKPKLVGKASLSLLGSMRLEEECVRYYPSGKKRSISHYISGILTGELYTFFPNGRLYDEKLFDGKHPRDERYDYGFVVIASNDSTGKEMVVDSTGHYIDYYDDSFKQIKEEGDFKAGKKTGNWTGKYYWTDEKGKRTDSVFYVESYEDGVLKLGKATKADNTTLEYKQRTIEPEFPGGPNAFNRYLANNIKFPAIDRENNITGKVYVSFFIETDGSLTNAKAVRGPSETEKAEALHAVQMSPKWIPGKLFGQTARVSYTVPINFTLSTSN